MERSKVLWIGLLGLILFSCQDEDGLPQVDPSSSNAAANRWIFNVMEQVYLWLDDMRTPISEDSDPEDYFESLLFRPTDRFSVIYPDYQELINSLNGITLEAGYEFNLYREAAGSSNVIADYFLFGKRI